MSSPVSVGICLPTLAASFDESLLEAFPRGVGEACQITHGFIHLEQFALRSLAVNALHLKPSDERANRAVLGCERGIAMKRGSESRVF